MGFIVAKVILLLFLPPSILLLFLGVGFLVVKRYPRLGKGFIITGFLMLYLLSISPVSDALMKPLESRFPPLKGALLNPIAPIVILSGGATDLSWLGIQPAPSGASLARLIYGVMLYTHVSGAILIISGGSGNPEAHGISEADAMKNVAIALKVPDEDILIEGDSRNTLENVRALKGLVGENRITLVTSAFHMRRAVAMFRKEGMDVTPAPTDYRSEQQGLSFYDFIPVVNNLENSSIAIYEYLCLLWYGVRGII